MRIFRGQRGASLIETMMAIGILGMVAYFVVGMIRNGTVGQKSLQASDDARTITDNMAAVLSDTGACGYTLTGLNPAGAQPAEFTVIKDSLGHVVYQKDSTYGSRSLKLKSMHIGGPLTPTPAKDAKTGIQLWTPLGMTGGTAFVSVVWTQTNMSGTTGAQDLQRYFLVNALSLTGVGGNIATCQAMASSGGGGGGHWVLTASGDIYNNNSTGHVGIGTTGGPDPAAQLDVASMGSHSLFVTAGNNVGINTTSPAPDTSLTIRGTSTVRPQIFLDASALGDGMPARIRVYANSTSGGRAEYNVGVNSMTGGGTEFQIYSNVTGKTYLFADDGTFTAPADVKASSFISSSDERLKTDVRPAEGLAKVLRIEGVTFRWLKDRSPGMGFLAQAVEKIFPDIVVTNPTTGLKGIRYEALLAPLVEAVKELHALVQRALALGESNSARIAALEKSNAEKDAAIRELVRRVEALEGRREHEK